MRIGHYAIANNLVVAPMAGVTDRPFRQLCKRLGAGYAVSEMVASNPRLWRTEKSRRRTDHRGEVAPIAVQIAGADPGAAPLVVFDTHVDTVPPAPGWTLDPFTATRIDGAEGARIVGLGANDAKASVAAMVAAFTAAAALDLPGDFSKFLK